MSHILRMNEIELIEKTVGEKDCLRVLWRAIPIGYVFSKDDDHWRISTDIKGEFWALDEFPDQDLAVNALVNKKQQLDDFRLQQLSHTK